MHSCITCGPNWTIFMKWLVRVLNTWDGNTDYHDKETDTLTMKQIFTSSYKEDINLGGSKTMNPKT